jgi:hypothetical protein
MSSVMLSTLLALWVLALTAGVLFDGLVHLLLLAAMAIVVYRLVADEPTTA